MGRYTAAVCRLCRREGMKLYLKGEKCYTEKCPVHKRHTPPGMHGARPTRRKASEFGMRLREKQKLRRIYGIYETQFKNYFQQAARAKGVTGTRLLQLPETRLDNVVYRLGLAASRKAAGRAAPSWLELASDRSGGRVLAQPAREEIDVPVQEQLIVEYYSR